MYGPDHGAFPEPTTHYGAFELATEGLRARLLARRRHRRLGLRPFVVYGPGREVGESGHQPRVRSRRGRPQLHLPFTGKSGMVYVDDVGRLILAACTQAFQGAHVLNLVGDVQTPMRPSPRSAGISRRRNWPPPASRCN